MFFGWRLDFLDDRSKPAAVISGRKERTMPNRFEGDFCHLIRHRREQLDLTQQEVAGKIGVTTDCWRRLLHWIRMHLLFCGCRKFPHRSNHLYRTILQECLVQARAGLQALQISVPDDLRLRTLVRLALRYVRRDRTDFGIRQLIANHQLAQRYFAEFVIERETKGAKQ